MQHRTIELFGSRSHYWECNPDGAATIVLVHGFRGTHHGLLDIMESLPDYRLVIPDLPGFGDSTPMTEQPHTVAGYADFITALIRELGLGPVGLLGHSMGTLVAARVAAKNPALISRLILINPIAGYPTSGLGAVGVTLGNWYMKLAGVMPERPAHWLLTNRLQLDLTSLSMIKTRDPALRREIYRTHRTYMVRFAHRRVLLEAYESSLADSTLNYAARIKAPTLIVAGRDDAIAPVVGAERLAAMLPDAKLVVLPHVGHLVHYEQPQAAVTAIIGFWPAPEPTGSAAVGSRV